MALWQELELILSSECTIELEYSTPCRRVLGGLPLLCCDRVCAFLMALVIIEVPPDREIGVSWRDEKRGVAEQKIVRAGAAKKVGTVAHEPWVG